MRNASGYLVICDPDRPQAVERDTITCGHCQRVVFTKPGTVATVYLLPHPPDPDTEVAGAFCRICMRSVCLRCDAHGHCTPFELAIERQESRMRLRQVVGV